MKFLSTLALTTVLTLVLAASALAFPHQNQPDGTTCCFTSEAMMLNALRGKHLDAYDVKRQFSHYYVGAADWGLFPAVAKTYHFNLEEYGMQRSNETSMSSLEQRDVWLGLQRAKELIPYGAMAIILARGEGKVPYKKSIFTGSGHCMLLYDFVNGRFKLSNPNGKGPEPRKGYTVRQLVFKGIVVHVAIYYDSMASWSEGGQPSEEVSLLG